MWTKGRDNIVTIDWDQLLLVYDPVKFGFLRAFGIGDKAINTNYMLYFTSDAKEKWVPLLFETQRYQTINFLLKN